MIGSKRRLLGTAALSALSAELDYVPMPDSVTKLVEAAWKNNLKDTSGKPIW